MVATQALLALFALPAAFATPLTRRQGDPQVSLSLEPSNVMKGLEQDGQGADVEPGQVRSLTSSNNFINFCLTVPVPITDGKQIDGGSCNPAPIGRVAAKNKMPASKFFNPPNFSDTLVEDESFDIKMKIQNVVTGLFTNPNTNYYASPQQVDDNGIIKGHTHVTIQRMPGDDIRSTTTINPKDFAFFKGINQAADGNGVLTQNVKDGLKAGNYRMCSINASMSHAPVIVAIAQHGCLDDCIYFTVKPRGGGGGNGNNNGNNNGNGNGNGNGNNGGGNGNGNGKGRGNGNGGKNNNNNGNSVQDVGNDANTGGADPSKDTAAPPKDSPDASETESTTTAAPAATGTGKADATETATETSAAPPAKTSAAQGNNNGGNKNGGNKLPPFLQDLINQILQKGKDFFQRFRQQQNN